VLVLYVVPILGFLVYKLLGFLGLGAVVYTLILALRANRAAKDGPSAAAAPFRPASPPAGEVPPSGAAATQGPAFAGATPSEAAPGTSAGAGAGTSAGAGPGATTAAGAAAQPITAALPRAGFWIRMGALFLDFLLVGFVLSVLHTRHFELVVLAAYGAVMWKVRGSTIGGIVFDLRVVRLDGREVDWETAIVRALSCFLSMVVVGLGFFWIAFDDNHQAWHDKIAGTVVVRVPKGVPLV
jgi:uncharacterized RDD family membrane protein YckC